MARREFAKIRPKSFTIRPFSADIRIREVTVRMVLQKYDRRLRDREKRMIQNFLKDQSGAVTVDWVVLTAAVVGLGIATLGAVSSGVANSSDDVATQLTDQAISTSFGAVDALTTAFNGMTTNDYVTYGQSLAPGNNGAVYGHATTLAQQDAPDGYNFDDPLHDPDSNNLIYTSDDGLNYSIGGVVTPVESYSGTAAYFGA